MPRVLLFLALVAALLLLPTAAGGQSGSPNRGPAAKDKAQGRISVRAGKPATTSRVPARLARVRAQQRPASSVRVADEQSATEGAAVPTSAPTTADDDDEVADDDELDENDDHSSTGNVDDEDADDDHSSTGNVDDEGDDDHGPGAVDDEEDGEDDD